MHKIIDVKRYDIVTRFVPSDSSQTSDDQSVMDVSLEAILKPPGNMARQWLVWGSSCIQD